MKIRSRMTAAAVIFAAAVSCGLWWMAERAPRQPLPDLVATAAPGGVPLWVQRHELTVADRDPARGGCAVGTPPAHLGMRLVADVPPPEVRVFSPGA